MFRVWWPAALVPNWTDVLDKSETGREYVNTGVGRERGVENQEVAFKWGQEATFTLKTRAEIPATLLETFVTAQGRWGRMAMP